MERQSIRGKAMNRRKQFVPILMFLSLSAIDRVHADEPGYTFSINGTPVQPIHYSLNGDDSPMSPGDVIYIGDNQFNYGGLFMTLGEEKDCRFVTLPAETGDAKDRDAGNRPSPKDGRVFLQLADGRQIVVAVIITQAAIRRAVDPNASTTGKKQLPIFDRVPVNPLDAMSPEEIHGLWGIHLSDWPEGIEQKLAQVDGNRVCVHVGDSAGIGRQSSFLGGPVFPPVPTSIRYLIVRGTNKPGLRDFSHFGQFHSLSFLIFQSMGREAALNIDLVSQNASLQYLDVSGGYIVNPTKLASLTNLRFLNVARRQNIDDIEFVKDMRQLRTLILAGTPVRNLSPLDGSDSIHEIQASMTRVQDLPKGDLPSLRTMNLMSARVNAETVAQFRKAHPTCQVAFGWADSLRNAVRETTRIRIRTGGTCHRQPNQEQTLAEVTKKDEVDHFLDGIAIDEAGSNFFCGCCGNPTLEFYEGDRLLAMVGYHHGQSLRWAGGTWPTDALLTQSSQAFMVSWLARHGVQGPRREVDERQKQRDEEARRTQRYTALIPEQTRAALAQAWQSPELRNDNGRGDVRERLFAEAFIKREKDAQTSIELYLRLLGVTGEYPWNYYHEYQQTITKHLLPRFAGLELAQTVTSVMKDDEGILGAARWLLWENGWRNLDESDHERILPSLAERALQHRSMGTRKDVMYVLSDIRDAWAAQPLRQMLSRPTDPNWAPPQMKYGRRIDLPDGGRVVSDECSDAVWAAFCLAKRGDQPSLPAIEQLAAQSQGRDKELLEAAIRLLQNNMQEEPKVTP
jgi:hypothetical protein